MTYGPRLTQTYGIFRAAIIPSPLLNRIFRILVCYLAWVPFFFFFKIFFIYFERGGEGGRKRGRETSIGFLSYVPQPGTDPATQACALTWNQPFALQDDAQPSESHQSGPQSFLLKSDKKCTVPKPLKNPQLY